SPDVIVAYLKAWLEVARDFKEQPNKVADAIYAFYTGKGYTMSQDTFRKALANVDVDPGFPGDLKPYMQEKAEILLKEKKIAGVPGLQRTTSVLRCARDTRWQIDDQQFGVLNAR